MEIATIGLWHLGTIYSVCLSALGNKVYAITETPNFEEKLMKGQTDLYEPRLIDLLKKDIKIKSLTFTTDIKTIRNCQVVWITIDTPTDINNLPDTRGLLKTLTKISINLRQDSIVVVSSQLPIGTCAKIENILSKNKSKRIGFAYVPENLRLGQSIDNFFHQDRVVVGTNDDIVFKKVVQILKSTTKSFIKVNPQTAEMIKHATNSFLATSLSFINDISDMCERVGADVYEVSNALRADSRIGPKAYLGAGLGFSGVTLERDLKALMEEAKKQKIELPVISSVEKKNNLRKLYFFKKLKSYAGKLKGEKIAVWGVTYKEGVATLRGSLPIELIKKIVRLGADVTIYGDKTSGEKIINELPEKHVEILSDQYMVLKNAKALLLLSPVTEKDINYSKIRKLLAPPYLVFDCYNSFYGHEKKFKEKGILYVGVGR